MTSTRQPARSTSRSLAIRGIAAIVAGVMLLTGLPFVWAGNTPAAADFGAGQPARYNENVNGDFLLVGETVFTCGSSSSTCRTTGVNNDDLNMVNADPDGNGALFNGSSGSFVIPSGAVVDAAYLYWGGNFGAKSGNSYYCNPSASAVSMSTADKGKANKVKLAVGAGGYSEITADQLYTHPAGGLNQTPTTASSSAGRWGLVYEGVADVTATFQNTAAATATPVRVADIQAAQGQNCHAGWALAVVYRFPANNCLDGNTDGANKRNDYRNVAIYDGLIRQALDGSDTVTTLSGFITTGTSAETATLRLGNVTWEGDQYIDGDSLRVKSTSASGTGTLVDPAGPAGTSNFFDSGKQPDADHNSDLDANPDSGAVIEQGYVNGRGDGHGIDAKTQTVGVPGGTSSIDVRFQTDGDNYYPGAFALSSPIKCLLAMDKDQAVNATTVSRDNSTTPNPAIKAGDELTFTVPVRAVGDVQLTSVVLSDAIPAGTTYVANSGKWGSGNTAALAAAGTTAASFASGKVTANVGTLDPLASNGTCASGKKCFGALTFKVTVNAGLAAGTVVTNQASGTFTASGVSNIKENSNEVTDRIGPRLTVSKSIVNPAAGDPSTFNFAVVCNGSPAPGSPFALANGASKVLTLAPGAACTVTETTNANYGVAVSGAIATNGGTVQMTEDRAVSFTNTRRYGQIQVAKTVAAVSGDPVAAPTFNFQVACPGISGYPRALQVGGTGGTAATPSDIPFGTSCTVTETANTGWAATPSVDVNPVDQATEVAAFTNTRRTGSLAIAKTTVGGDGTFSFAVDCAGTAFDSLRTVTTTGGSGSVTVTGIPAGIACKVTESVPAGWTLTSANDVSVTVAAGATVTAAFTNSRQTADLVITKAVVGDYAVPVAASFPFAVDCGPAGTFSPAISASDAQNGTTSIPGIPVGSTCSVTETLPAGWTLDQATTGNVNPRQVTIAGSGNQVTFTNRHDVGTLTVRKSIDQGSGTFAFDVTCNDVPVPTSPVSISITAPATSGSVEVPNVPRGARCVVDEVGNGSADGSFVQVTPANGAAVTIASTTAADTADFVNRRLTGDLVIAKEFPADSLGDPAREFEFTWNCGPEPRTVRLKAGARHTVTGLPTGTQCVVDETADSDYTTTMAPVDGTVTIATGENLVTVTNTRTSGTLTVRKSLVPATDDGRFDLLVAGTAQASGVGDGGSTGAQRLPVGSYVVAESPASGSPRTLGDYDTTLECLDRGQPVAVGSDGSVAVTAESEVVCTYTNRRKATIEVTKALTPADDPGIFSLTVDGNVVVTGGDGTTSGVIALPVGPHTVAETSGGADTTLADYDGSIDCTTNGGAPVPGGQVDLAYGDVVSCVVANVRKGADLSVTKTPVSAFAVPGGTATFAVTVTNAPGAGAARDVVVTDPLPAGTTYVSSQDDRCAPDGTRCELGDLARGGSRSFTITYRVDAAATATTVRNVATVSSPDDPDSPPAEADVPIARLSVVKTSDQSWFNAVGATVGYRYEVSNPGGIALTGVTVTDNKIPTSQIDCNGTDAGNGQPLTLAVGGSTTCVASVLATGTDVASGRIDNVATADSDQTEPTGDTWSVPLAALSVDKSLTATGPFAVGDTLTYDVVVTNTGQIALTGVGVADPAADAFDGALACTPPTPVGSLDPGARIECEASHVVTQGDVDAGTFTNTATATSNETPPASDGVTTTFGRTPTMALTKSVTSAGPYELGDTVSYSLVATNTGNVTLRGVRITESDGATITDCDPAGGGEADGDGGVTLRPGAKLTCNATHEVTQGDVDAGTHDNTATADSDQTAPVEDDATVPVAQAPALEVTKRVAADPEPPEDDYALGDTVHYEIEVENTGTTTLTGVRVTDAGLGASLGDCEPGLPATLAPGESLTCAATHVITQADVDAGEYSNLATGRSDQTPPGTDGEIVQVGQDPSLELTKTVTSAGPYQVDDLVQFRLVVENTGNMTLTGVTIAERTPGVDLGDCEPTQPATLAPGDELECLATHAVTQEDIDAGAFVNVARADSDQTPPDDDEVEVPFDQDPSMELTKTVTSGGPYVLGSTVEYLLVATNTGNTTLNSVRITETEGATLGSCDPGDAGVSLAPGAQLSCVASHVVTQVDVDAGEHPNTAIADSDETEPVDDAADVNVFQDPALDVTKTIATEPAPPAGGYAVGDTIRYAIVVTNTGTVTLTDVVVTDPNADGFDPAADCDTPSPFATLAVGARITCSASHEVTQGDVDSGSFRNTALADSNETPRVDDDVVTPFAQTPVLGFDKLVTSTGPYQLGDTVTYSLVATNEGNTTLDGVRITESDGAELGDCLPGPDGVSLAPTEQLVCSATHVVTQADVDAGTHPNTAIADSDQTDPVDDTADVAIVRDPGLAITKTITSEGPYAVGSLLSFRITATNTGNTTLTGVTIAEITEDAQLGTCLPALPATLAVGAAVDCTATHVVDQSDLDAGSYDNVAEADSTETPAVRDDVEQTFDRSPALGVVKSVTSDGPYGLGDTVSYSIVATNTGNITLHNVRIVESEGATLGDCDPSLADDASVPLAPGATLTCEATHEIGQGDVDAGSHTNVATADSDETSPVDDDAQVPVEQTPGLDVAKSVVSDGPYVVGDTVEFRIVATNTGNQTLTGVGVAELTPGVDLVGCSPALPASLAPDAEVTCSATHQVTQVDVDAGSFTNVAAADSDQTEPVDDDAVVPFDQDPSLEIVKTVTNSGPYELGDLVTYSIVATNTGNTTLDEVVISESEGALLGDCVPTTAPDATGVSLAPLATLSCDAVYEVTQADVDAGSHTNTATADSAQTGPVSDDAEVTVYQDHSLAITKSIALEPAPPVDGYEVGDTIRYTVVVTNDGNTTLSDVVVTDTDADGFDAATACLPAAPAATLAVGASITCTAAHVVTQRDVDAGSFTNVAAADSTETAEVRDDVATPFASTPLLSLDKVVTSDGPYELGDTVTYSLTATNVGNITLRGVVIDESEGATLGDCEPVPGDGEDGVTLAPQASLVCEASYEITQRDVDAGTHTNTATADSDETEPVDDEAEVPVYQDHSLELVKTVTSDGPYELGDTVSYSIVATNAGNTTLHDVVISESEGATLGDCAPATGDDEDGVTLAPGDQLVCEASYEVTQGDVDAGTHTNTATADSEETESVDDDAVVPVFQDPELGLVKTVTSEGPHEVGDTVEFRIVATNTGNVTLTGVTVSELTEATTLGTCEPAVPASLAPAAKVTCAATHVVTQADVDAGTFTNVAEADSEQTPPVTDDVEVTFEQDPALGIDKTVTGEGPYALGDTVSYSIVASNTGNVTLTDVRITESEGAVLGSCDPALPVAEGDGAPEGDTPVGVTLAPGARLTCAASHVVTQADVDAGSHTNVATADSALTDPVDDEAEVDIERAPGLIVTKTVTSSAPYALGSPITFSVVVENTGTTTLTGVTVTEQNTDATLEGCEPPTPATLAPGDDITCTAVHAVTQADFDAGQYVNVVLADSEQTDPSQDDETVPTPDPAVDLAISKRLVGDLVSGREGTYELDVTNRGPATATSVVVTDSVPAGLRLVSVEGRDWTCTTDGNDLLCSADRSLASGDSMPTLTVKVQVEASGSETVVNTAVVSGEQVDRDPSNNRDSVTTGITEVGGETVEPVRPEPSPEPTEPEVRGFARLRNLAFTGGGLLLGGVGLVLIVGGGVLFGMSKRRKDEEDEDASSVGAGVGGNGGVEPDDEA